MYMIENAAGLPAGARATIAQNSAGAAGARPESRLGAAGKPSAVHARLPMRDIRTDGGTQARVSLHESVQADYAQVLRDGGTLPAVTVFDDGATVWLADGFHRLGAHRLAGAVEIDCEVRFGALRDAMLFAAGANARHGLRRSNQDKRHAVAMLLADATLSTWSDNAIANACGVSHPFVGDVRRAMLKPLQERPLACAATQQDAIRIVTRKGKTFGQNTANIGKGKLARAPAPQLVSALAQGAPAAGAEALREQVAELKASLAESVADNAMMGRVFDADDKLGAAMAEAGRQRALAENAERTLAARSGEFIERARAVVYWKNRAAKAEKELAKRKAGL